MMAIMFSFGYSSFIIFLVFGCLLIHDYQMWPQILPIQLIPSSILTHIVTAMHTLCIFVLLLLQHNIQANLESVQTLSVSNMTILSVHAQ